MTRFPHGLSSFGVPVLPGMPPLFGFNSKPVFCDPANGSDDNNGLEPKKPVKTLYKAHSLMTDGANDVCFLISTSTAASSTAGTARLSLANAVSVDSTATVGTLKWTKSSAHLIGVCAGGSISQRARIAPPSGTYTAATFDSGNLVTVSGQNCLFANFDVFHGFSTGGASQIAWTDTGGRNCYRNVNLQGGGDTDARATQTFRSLLLSGSTGENTFVGCTIGLDTLIGTGATIELEIAGGSPRNRFEDCIIETYAGSNTAFWVKIGASGIDRYVLFRNCMFTNPVLPASAANATAMTVGMSIDAAAGGTVQVMNSMYYGAATMSTSALCFSNLGAGNAKGGLGVVAS